jgi:hypothetical protein
VGFHESFWVATSAAVPVIALAAVVALPDASRMAHTAARQRHRAQRNPDPTRDTPALVELLGAAQDFWWSRLVWWTTFVNLTIQAALLAVSLSALAYDSDLMPQWVAIVLAVGGILLLAWSTSNAIRLPRQPIEPSGFGATPKNGR